MWLSYKDSTFFFISKQLYVLLCPVETSFCTSRHHSLLYYSVSSPERLFDGPNILYIYSTVCLLGVTGVLAPLLEETVFRGFFMASMTKWYVEIFSGNVRSLV